ncbi:MAG: hypothetical protein ACI4WR_01570, partial [Bulleidia sp.]
CALLVPVLISCCGVMAKAADRPAALQDEIALAQIRHILNAAGNIRTEGDTLFLNYHDRESSISLINGNLVMKPGTLILLTNLEDVSFSESDGCILLSWQREQEDVTERTIGHV